MYSKKDETIQFFLRELFSEPKTTNFTSELNLKIDEILFNKINGTNNQTSFHNLFNSDFIFNHV